jgi:hypothetical protein
LANAYMIRGIRHPIRILADSRGALQAVIAFCLSQPSGYRDGPHFARSRTSYVAGCRDLSARFQETSRTPPDALDTFIFYPDVIRIDWRRCPIIVHDRLGLLNSLGIGISLFEAIPTIIETPAFMKALTKLDTRIERSGFAERSILRVLCSSGATGSKNGSPGGSDSYSVNVDGNYRVHLRRDRESDSWIAESIGVHKSMGHG